VTAQLVSHAFVGAHLRVRPHAGGHMGPPLQMSRGCVIQVPEFPHNAGLGFGVSLAPNTWHLKPALAAPGT
jgi:hypothetical protein